MNNTYDAFYSRSIQEPEAFWREQASHLKWHTFPTKILSQDERGYGRWFEDGELNTSYLALDAHVEAGHGDRTALIYDSPVTGVKADFSYRQMRDEVARVAGGLKKLGVAKGDRVIIYMPMVPEAVMAMLACARIGAIHSVVFGGFAPHELALRIDDAEPKVILTASSGVEINRVIEYKPMVDKAIEEAHYKPQSTVVLQRKVHECVLGNSLDWNEWLKDVTPAEPVKLKSWDPLYILYTSGTTGKPKGIVRDQGGHAVALNFSMKAVYDTNPGDVFFAASDIGWVVGHSYIVYGTLIKGATTVLYEGKPIKTPDAGAFWRLIEEYRVKTLFCAPTALRAIRKEDPNGEMVQGRDLSSLKALYVAGERLDTSTYDWAKNLLKVSVVDNWWQTETGWPIVANMRGVSELPNKPGSATRAVAGFDVRILDDGGHELARGKEGAVAIKLPMPPGCLPTLWRAEERFQKGYLETFPGFYVSGDGGIIDEDGYVFLLGRIDDVINVAGHRLSTAEMEELIAKHPAVAECAVFGMNDELKGQLPLGLVVLKENVSTTQGQLASELMQMVRDQIGAVASYKTTLIVKRLPKTRSGKILRAILRKMSAKESFAVPSTIEDASVLDEIREVFEKEIY